MLKKKQNEKIFDDEDVWRKKTSTYIRKIDIEITIKFVFAKMIKREEKNDDIYLCENDDNKIIMHHMQHTQKKQKKNKKRK